MFSKLGRRATNGSRLEEADNKTGPACAASLVFCQSRPQSFVPLDQRSEHKSSGSNHFEITKEITEFWLSGSLRICIYGTCLKWLLPELSRFLTAGQGERSSGNEIGVLCACHTKLTDITD